MEKYIQMIISGMFSSFMLWISFADGNAVEYYVSHSGNDSWSGKIADPNDNKTDGPFKSLYRARDAVRELRGKGPLSPESIIVSIRGGNYTITETFNLDAEDSGYLHAPVIWRAFPGEQVIFTGGKEITGFAAITDESVLKRINKKYRSRILRADLKKLGIKDYGTIDARNIKRRELYFNGRFMEIARYPNQGWLKIIDIPQNGGEPVFSGVHPHKRFGIPVGRHFGKITYGDDHPGMWEKNSEIWMHGYWTWDWSDGFVKIKKIDTDKKEIYISEPHHSYGYTKEQRYYYLNVLEELDTPGEWYLDGMNGELYFWPPADIKDGVVYFPFLEDNMISLEKTDYVTIQGIRFQVSRAGAVEINGGSNNKVAGCTFTNLGKYAVVINGGINNGVTGCDIFEVASGGIVMSGGDRKTLTPAGNYAVNNYIHHFAVRNKTYHYAVRMNGVGNRIAHNKIHDAPHIAIGWGGNENIIEFNEIYNVLLETNDAGAIYGGRNPSMQGNIIRYNYFHHIGKESGHGTNSVYFDDYHCGNYVIGNVFYKGGIPGRARMGAVFIHAGRYNVIDNNIFVECPQAYGVSHWNKASMDRWIPAHGWEKKLYDEVNILEPPYSTRYPWLRDIMEDRRLNTLSRNLVYKCGSFIGRGEAVEIDNLVTDEDPGFMNAESQNFMLKDDSYVYKRIPGFKKIPFDKIGLYTDQYRKSLP